MIFIAGFGWGKPVPVNTANLRVGDRVGMAAVSLAGPLSNVIVAALLSIPIKVGAVASSFIGSLVFWNLLLGAFNLIPLAPLDGFKVALPGHMASTLGRFERQGPVILLLIIMIDLLVPGPGILFSIMRPILNAINFVVLGRQLL